MHKTREFFIILLLLTVGPLSGLTPNSASPIEEPSDSSAAARRLRADLDRIFSDPQFDNAQWGVEVYSLDRSERLYDKNASRLYIPASNNKIITAAVALLRLGPDYRFRTQLFTDGFIADGVLKGNLMVTGSGDPSGSSRMQAGDIFYTVKSLASQLKQRGIQSISGDLIGGGGAFGETMLGQGWGWDDLAEGYAAPVSPLQFNENVVWLEIAPGMKPGDAASIKMEPLPGYLTVENRVITGTGEIPTQIGITRGSAGESILVSGVVSLKSSAIKRAVAVQCPILYFLSALKHTLAAEGIDVLSCGIREMKGFIPQSPSLLYTHSSPPLWEIIRSILKFSQNLGAETLVRILGLELRGDGSFAKGKEVVQETLSQLGISGEGYLFADGSGLSRLNLASANTLVRILGSMHKHPSFECFYDALPVAGLDGTLAGRMKGTKAENNVHAKTGSIANVSAISGYVRTLDGELLAFSMIANNFLGPKARADMAQDRALERLAGFSRK